MKALKEQGFESPYLRPFVVARINPLRFQQGAKAEFDATIAKMLASARKFKAESSSPNTSRAPAVRRTRSRRRSMRRSIPGARVVALVLARPRRRGPAPPAPTSRRRRSST